MSKVAIKHVMLGRRTGITFVDGVKIGVQWQVGSLVYTMSLIPSEGETASLTQLDQVLNQLTWSQ